MTQKLTRLLGALMVVALLAVPQTARAQCEVPGVPESAAAALTTMQVGAVTGMTAAIIAAVETSTSVARAAMSAGLEVGWLMLRDRLNQYWQDQQQALKEQTAQRSAGSLDQTRQLGSLADTGVVAAASRHIQRAEYDAARTFTTTDEGCRFDTTGPYLGRAMSVSRGVAGAAVTDMMGDMAGREGRPSARGPGADIAERARVNRDMFCDINANGGNPGCTEHAGEFADAHVLPSRTFFGNDTLDLDDPRTLPAVNELARNILGYDVANPTSESALTSATGREDRMRQRELIAQTDATAGLVWSVVAERMPAGAAPEVEQMRLRIGGSQPSAEPSEYEIRQQLVEQLWDPEYYADMQDTSTATQQKQIYLRAYSVMQMYKLLEKMERIANVYAIQTSNMVDRTGRGLSGLSGTGAATPAPAAPAAEGAE